MRDKFDGKGAAAPLKGPMPFCGLGKRNLSSLIQEVEKGQM